MFAVWHFDLTWPDAYVWPHIIKFYLFWPVTSQFDHPDHLATHIFHISAVIVILISSNCFPLVFSVIRLPKAILSWPSWAAAAVGVSGNGFCFPTVTWWKGKVWSSWTVASSSLLPSLQNFIHGSQGAAFFCFLFRPSENQVCFLFTFAIYRKVISVIRVPSEL